ncbi:hypothetical protein FKW77_010871 [Venturia effusa]|uniref:Uncharacterized protein n=1 Tax=Venturia effusa TaxID=50376 RepID=A0A517KYP8_9PEZI|nr:hypothetical protein FKW77_010871 [Venturia effusa]
MSPTTRPPLVIPDFSPSISSLKESCNAIQQAITQYENAGTDSSRSTALEAIQNTSNTFSKLVKNPTEIIADLTFRLNLNFASRIAIEMGLYTSLPKDNSYISLADLAKATNATEEFTLRIARLLASFDFIKQQYTANDPKENPQYAHAFTSRVLTTSPGIAGSKFCFDTLHRSAFAAIPSFYTKHGFRSPQHSTNTVFSHAHGTSSQGFFEILEQRPAELAVFNEAMRSEARLTMGGLLGLYPFGELVGNAEGVVLVDVGGGKGHSLVEICRQRPELEGKVVLQDLQRVLDGGVLVDKEKTGLMGYDFFSEVQPIKGSNYFFKRIFHDWPEEECKTILRNLAPSMCPTSKLLICDTLIHDEKPDPLLLLRDISMMTMGGKERSLRQWSELLGSEGFRIKRTFKDAKCRDVDILEVVFEGVDGARL